jgi:hypothetical protein
MIDINEIDVGIRDWVLFLINNGFKTFSSCQGSGKKGTTHGKIPYILIHSDENSTCDETVERLKSIIEDNCYIHICKSGNNSLLPDEYIYFNPPYCILIQSFQNESE